MKVLLIENKKELSLIKKDHYHLCAKKEVVINIPTPNTRNMKFEKGIMVDIYV